MRRLQAYYSHYELHLVSDTSEYIFTEDFSLGFEIPSCEITRNENLFWTLYSNFALSPSVNIEEFDDDGQISTPQRFSFSDTGKATVVELKSGLYFNFRVYTSLHDF